MAGQLVLVTTGPIRKFTSTTQVQEGDQPSLPIHDRSFVAQGGSWMPCAPAEEELETTQSGAFVD